MRSTLRRAGAWIVEATYVLFVVVLVGGVVLLTLMGAAALLS